MNLLEFDPGTLPIEQASGSKQLRPHLLDRESKRLARTSANMALEQSGNLVGAAKCQKGRQRQCRAHNQCLRLQLFTRLQQR